MRKLDERQTVDTIKFTYQQPYIRANKINQAQQILDYKQNEYMQDFAMLLLSKRLYMESMW